MSFAEKGIDLEAIGIVQNGRPVGSEGPVKIVDNVVVSASTGRRSVTSPVRMGMFDGNPNIREKREATVPHGTPILRTRRP